MLAFATGVLIVGGRVFAGLLGGWIGDQVGYDYAHRKLADRMGRRTSASARHASAALAAATRRAAAHRCVSPSPE